MLASVRSAARRGDFEVAHSAEDDMREAILRAVAAGVPNARELATIALATNRILFKRACA